MAADRKVDQELTSLRSSADAKCSAYLVFSVMKPSPDLSQTSFSSVRGS